MPYKTLKELTDKCKQLHMTEVRMARGWRRKDYREAFMIGVLSKPLGGEKADIQKLVDSTEQELIKFGVKFSPGQRFDWFVGNTRPIIVLNFNVHIALPPKD